MLAKSGKFSLKYYDGTVEIMKGLVSYEYYPLGDRSEEYHVSFATENDWYYSRISSFSGGRMSTSASLDLLSPQKEADSE